MKKTLKIIKIVVIILISTFLCWLGIVLYIIHFAPIDKPSEFTYSWQTVYVDDVGSFRVPAEWNVEQQGKITYITDAAMNENEYQIYCVGTIFHTYPANEMPPPGPLNPPLEPHNLIEGVEKGETISYTKFTMGSGFCRQEYYVDGAKVERFLILSRKSGQVLNY